MKNPRFTGLLLLLTGALVLMGNTLDALPPQAFWAGFLTYPIGAYLFFFGSRHVSAASPGERARRPMARPPKPRPSHEAPAPESPVETGSRIVESLRRPAGSEPASTAGAPPEPLAFHDLDDEEAASGSRPVTVQEPQSLSDQLEKLAKLQQQGIISAEEYAVAKTRLLG